MASKTWGGRFSQAPAELAKRFGASVDIDSRLAEVDIEGSLAHARMLTAQGILTKEECESICSGLEAIRTEIRAGKFVWSDELEDVHMNIEAALSARIGAAGGKLHTARSRNDQVCTDMRLWTRAACDETCGKIARVQAVLVGIADEQIDTLMPGYTHLQRAQPVRLSHHLLAWSEMLLRDHGRLQDARRRLNQSPLGSGALATTTFAIDRAHTARALGFDEPTRNSLDTVADRDFLVEVVAALANLAIHLSRVCEELVLWSSQEFSFVRMSDAFTTGSSMMPQKKNPDMAELIRGKSGRVVGDLVSLIVMLKGLPLTYNRDMQEDKRPVFDAFDTVNDCLDVLAGSLATATFDHEAMREALVRGFVDATEVADWLSARGVPFRDAHHVVGRLVGTCAQQGRTLSDLSVAELRQEHEAFDETIYEALKPEVAVERRDVVGGPAKRQVEQAISEWRVRLATEAFGNLDVPATLVETRA